MNNSSLKQLNAKKFMKNCKRSPDSKASTAKTRGSLSKTQRQREKDKKKWKEALPTPSKSEKKKRKIKKGDRKKIPK